MIFFFTHSYFNSYTYNTLNIIYSLSGLPNYITNLFLFIYVIWFLLRHGSKPFPDVGSQTVHSKRSRDSKIYVVYHFKFDYFFLVMSLRL